MMSDTQTLTDEDFDEKPTKERILAVVYWLADSARDIKERQIEEDLLALARRHDSRIN